MSWLSRLFSRQSSREPPRFVVNGHALWWDWRSVGPALSVWVDGADDALPAARAAVRSMPGSHLLWPVPMEVDTRNAFYANRLNHWASIVVRPYVMTETPGAFRCDSDVRFDLQTGEIRSAVIEWNLAPGDYDGNVRRLVHELGHCLGLGHQDGTIMQSAFTEAPVGWFSREQIAFLEGLGR